MVSGINAIMLGAQSVNPNIKLKIIWVNTWFDPGKEADAAKALFDQGADIMAQHTDLPAATQIADAARQVVVRPGLRHDQVRAEVAAHLDRGQLGALLLDRVQAALDEKWTPDNFWLGIEAASTWRPTPTCPTT